MQIPFGNMLKFEVKILEFILKLGKKNNEKSTQKPLTSLEYVGQRGILKEKENGVTGRPLILTCHWIRSNLF